MSKRKDQVEEAFKKLLSFVYYDKSGTMVHLRERMASRIARDGKDKIVKNVIDCLTNPKKFNSYLDKIDIKVIPKGVKSSRNDEILLTNDRTEKKNNIEDVNLMFDGPVELFLISVYWLIEHGHKLDKELGDCCYGNRLILNEKKDGIRKGRGLLKPYIHQYQRWRDNATKSAKQQLEVGNNVGFINLDITKFYYNVRLDWDVLESNIDFSSQKRINSLLYKIHRHYTDLVVERYGLIFGLEEKLFEEKRVTILPIGLPSSYTLANYHLIEFDNDVRSRIKPIYYGRYVDDILIVIPNPTPAKKHGKFYSDVYKDRLLMGLALKKHAPTSTRFIYNNLKRIFRIEYLQKDSDAEKLQGEEDQRFKVESHINDIDNYKLVFKTKSLETLYIQNKKIMVYEFSADHSLSVIEKLKHDLDERSSEFRFLPTMEDANFDKDAFHLLFDDSFGKPRTLKDYKENRFGIASYLYKRAAVAQWTSKAEMYDEANKILAFFKGSNIIRFYQQWERLFTYFVIAGRMKEFSQLCDAVFEEISKVSFNDDPDDTVTGVLKANLIKIFNVSISQALALDPAFINNSWFSERIYSSFEQRFGSEFPTNVDKMEGLILNIRKSYLVRHYFIYHPLLEYTRYSEGNSVKELKSLVAKSFNFDEFALNDLKLRLRNISFPRFIKFYEVCIYLWRYKILSASDIYKISKDDSTDFFLADKFLNKAWKIYSLINYGNSHGGENDEGIERKKIFFETPEYAPSSNHIKEIRINESESSESKHFTLALANMKVSWEKEAQKSLKNRPNKLSIDRQQKYSRLLNKLTEEKESGSDLFILPEISVHNDMVSMLAFYGMKHQIALLFGTEHIRAGKLGFNFINSVLPVRINGEMVDAIFLPRLKNHYSHQETVELDAHQLIPARSIKSQYHLIKFRGCYYTTFYCFELSDIEHRSWFRGKVDFLASSEFNKDTNYFSNIVESTARDLNTFVVQVNSSNWGDTRITQPSKTELKDILRIKGGDNDVIIIGKLKTKEFRHFQEVGYNLQKKNKIYKPTPPNFDVKYVQRRINGEWVLDEKDK